MVHRDAVRRTDGVLAAVTLADAVLLVVLAIEVELEVINDIPCNLRQPVLLDQRQYCKFDRRKHRRYTEHDPLLPVVQLFLAVGCGEHGQEHPVETDGCLYDVRGVAFPCLWIKILNLAAGEFLMIAQVKIGPRVNAFQFLEAEGELELDVGGRVGIVGQLLVIMETVLLISQSESLVPLQAGLLPLGEPLQLRAGTHEELHLHLLELPHAEDELTGGR